MKYQIPIIIVLVLLLVLIFYWRRRGKEKLKGKKKSNTKNKKNTKTSKRSSNLSADEQKLEEELEEINGDNEEADDDLIADARELYDLIHEDMAGGMQLDGFEDMAGDLAGGDPAEVFIEIKQMYTDAINKNMDPLRTVTVEDYVKALQHT